MKLSGPMQDALVKIASAMPLTGNRSLALLPCHGRTAQALEDRGLIECVTVNTGGGYRWKLTDAGWELASGMELAARGCNCPTPSISHEDGCPVGATVTRNVAALMDDAAEILASLPEIGGYRWQWFNPQGGLPESRTVIQLMHADSRSVSPAAVLKRNGDGTWHATRGGAWSYSGYIGTFIAGKYQASFTMLQCAGLIAAEADERGMLAAWARLQDEAKLAADADTQMLARYAAGQKEHREKVGKLCKIKQSSAGHRAKWRRGGQR